MRATSIGAKPQAYLPAAARPCRRVSSQLRPFSASKPVLTRNLVCRADTKNEVDLEAQVEAFMKRQAELESGAAFARTKDPEVVLGADVVSAEAAKQYCADIFEILRTLKRTRDMSVAEVRLVVSIEDPRARERRANDIEDERGVSRDEMAAALTEVAEGRIPKDRIALRCLHEEITNWPFLEVVRAEEAAAAAKESVPVSDYAAALKDGDTIAKPYIMGNKAREGDKPQGLADMLPDWVGYGALYGISFIPVLLVVGTVLILFYNSLK
eukprot:CAMPEP_0202901922 /NCGR_PEP_ID=MMETSP1392-20130828/15337_1 /ASSEMBLY_ACC=CAM_ASM_000868 /TAXON_ID=225041 /ORGANISM="Chlamydomonas chlamydogama, Strain SAG 11-48b" /LENGTH=268 /DNA_ID=CAMNT_0049588581 /DNA_START=39 /DNA_END=845 /DNA_ORIENTATION=+